MLSFSLHCLRGRLVYVCDTMPLKQFSTYVPFSSPFTSSSSDDARSEEFSTRRVISSLEVLCQMSTNIECIHLIIVSLQRHLPEIISLNESQNTIWRLHSGLSRLFNRSLQVRPVCVCVCRCPSVPTALITRSAYLLLHSSTSSISGLLLVPFN